MAKSNNTLIEEITAEATAKGVDVPVTEGKKNKELETILKNLKTPPPPPADDKGTGDDVTGDADTTKANDEDDEDDEDDDPEPDEKSKFEYSVAPGVSITCKGARILADGDEITKKDIPSASFKAFLKSGKIKKG